MTSKYFTHINEEFEKPEPRSLFTMLDEKGFDNTKSSKYLTTMMAQKSNNNFIGSFKAMVKSDESFQISNDIRDTNNHLVTEERPRFISIPDASTCGALCIVQGAFWNSIKTADPGFIQGLSKKDLLTLLKSKVCADWKSISIDGSAFDSSQYTALISQVDHKFWKLPVVREIIMEHLQASGFTSPDATSELIKAAIRVDHLLFINIPGINSATFTAKEKAAFRKS